ncbi:MAG: tagaturonate reductase, partial [Bacteroidota bacterium]
LFTHRIEGVKEGEMIQEFEVNDVIADTLSAVDAWEEVLAYARKPEASIIVSNTTEIGIQYKADQLTASPPETYPAKLTAFLHERFLHLPDSETVVLPTELLEDNGEKVKEIVLKHARDHKLGEAFLQWLAEKVCFCCTLVDRIVTGMPPQEKFVTLSEELGYRDELLTVSEPYYLWAIQGPQHLSSILSFTQGDSQVMLTEDITPYRERKLRILNGAHTISVALGHIYGLTYIHECLNDSLMGAFFERVIKQEIVPSLPNDIEGGDLFAEEVLDRFRNPFLNHKLLDITLQYTSKMEARNVPTFLRYMEKEGKVPSLMLLGFAAYLHWIRQLRQTDKGYEGEWQGNPYQVYDSKAGWWVETWKKLGGKEVEAWLPYLLQQESLWGNNLHQIPGFSDQIAAYYTSILEAGSRQTLEVALEC